MTFGEIQNEFQVIIDKSGSGWFTPYEQDIFLNLGQDEYVELCYANFEKDEKMREEMLPLVSAPTSFSSTTVINLSAITDFKYVLSVSAVITVTDIFSGTSSVTSAVQPRTLDAYIKNLTNSFTKPTPVFPVYQQWVVSSQKRIQVDAGGSTPTTLTLLYLKIPTVIDGTNNPGNSADFSDAVCRKIIALAARKALGVLENDGRVKTQEFEISQSQNVN